MGCEAELKRRFKRPEVHPERSPTLVQIWREESASTSKFCQTNPNFRSSSSAYKLQCRHKQDGSSRRIELLSKKDRARLVYGAFLIALNPSQRIVSVKSWLCEADGPRETGAGMQGSASAGPLQ